MGGFCITALINCMVVHMAAMNTEGGKDASQIIMIKFWRGPGKLSPPKREKYDT